MCIEKAIASNPKCPCDNLEILTSTSLSNNLAIKNMMNDLQVVCIECDTSKTTKSKSTKCNWKGVLSEMEDHLNDICEYVTSMCPYEGCNVTCMRKELDQHKSKCEFRMTKCPFKGCEKRMHFEKLPDHKITCVFMAEPCLNCEEMIDCLDTAEHLLKDCQYQDIPCPVPTICKCKEHTFYKADDNLDLFPCHNQVIIDMKRENDLLKLIPKAVVRICLQLFILID